jgi:hypothetical protein
VKTQQAEPAQSRERRGLRVRCSSQSALGPYTLLGRGRCVRRHALCAAMGLGAWQQTWRHLRERVSVHSLTPCVRRGALTRLRREWKRRNPVNATRAGGWDERVGALFCTLKYADHAGDCVVHTSVSLIALVVLDGEAKRMPRNPEQSCRVLACEYGCSVSCAARAQGRPTTHCSECFQGPVPYLRFDSASATRSTLERSFAVVGTMRRGPRRRVSPSFADRPAGTVDFTKNASPPRPLISDLGRLKAAKDSQASGHFSPPTVQMARASNGVQSMVP